MKQMFLIAYHYRDKLDEDDLRHLTKKFVELGEGPKPIAHYARLDGQGGFLLREFDDKPEEVYESVIRYGPYMDFDIVPVTTMEEAFPVISRVYA
jgi:hypothetical protein